MRILIINVCTGMSTGNICTDIACALDAMGHEVKIAYGWEPVPERSKKYAFQMGSKADTYLHALRTRLTDGAGFGSRRKTEQFLRWVREFDPDIIHLHNLHGYYIHIGLLFDYLRTCGKRIFWTLHDCWPLTGHTVYCDTVSCTRWVDGCHHCPLLKEYPRSLVDRSRRNWQRKKELFSGIPNLEIITPSDWLAGLVQRSILQEYPVHIIHNGIHTELFQPLPDDFRHYFHLENKILISTVAETPDALCALTAWANQLGSGFCFLLPHTVAGTLPKNILCIPTASPKELESLFRNGNGILTLSDPGSFQKFFPENPRFVASEAEIRKLPQQISCTDVPGFWTKKAKKKLNGKEILLGVTSVWNEQKGFSDFVKLAEQLTEQQIIMIGLTKPQLNALPSSIIGLERTSNAAELAEYYALSDYFLNLTYTDTYPTTNLEAISCGTPVISYRTGGSPESAEFFGACIPCGGVESAAELIRSHPHFSMLPHDFDKKTSTDEYVKLYCRDPAC